MHRPAARVALACFAATFGGGTAAADLLYVSDFSNDRVVAVDSATGATVRTFAAPSSGGGPQGLAVSADGSRLYTAVSFNNDVSLYAFDTATGAEVNRFDVGPASGSLGGLTLSADGGTLYLANTGGFGGFEDDEVYAVDADTGAVDFDASFFNLDRPTGVTLAPDGNSLFVSEEASDRVAQRDVATGSAVRTFSAGTVSNPSGVAVSADGSTLFAANISPVSGRSLVNVFEVATGRFVDAFAAPGTAAGNLVGLTLSSDGSTLFAADAFNDRLLTFDTATGASSVFSTAETFDSPTYLAFAAAPAAVPEPASAGLVLAAAGAFAGIRRRRRRSG